MARESYEVGISTVLPMRRPPFAIVADWPRKLSAALPRLEQLHPFAKKAVHRRTGQDYRERRSADGGRGGAAAHGMCAIALSVTTAVARHRRRRHGGGLRSSRPVVRADSGPPMAAGGNPMCAPLRECAPSLCFYGRLTVTRFRKLWISLPNRSTSMRNESCPSMQLSGLK